MSDQRDRPKQVTSFDVARHAGVSRAAVSRAFTPHASVSAETREKVHKAAKELGYRVNYLARSLINQRSDLVGVVAAGFDNPYRTMQIEQITRALLLRGFRPVLLPTSKNTDVSQVIEQLLHYRVSGVIVTSDSPSSELCRECAADGVPIVLINKGDDIEFVDRVICDNDRASILAADLLAETGCRKTAVVASAGTSFTAGRRVAAFLKRCEELGLQAETVALELNTYGKAFDAASAGQDWHWDGLFCISDYVACGAADGLRQAGRTIGPEGIRIIGHDDIPQASWDSYQLTTLAQPADTQARQAIELLTARIAQPDSPARTETTPVSLVRRKTC